MKANIVDLRYKMKDVLKALNRKERVEIVYRGKPKGVIVPVHEPVGKSVKESPFFGLSIHDPKPVAQVMEDLRGNRYRAL